MAACFSVVASELIRRGVVGGTGPGVVSVYLEAVPNPVNRSRAAARYRVRVTLAGAPVPWAAGVWLVDARGYLVAWSYQDVGKWLVKSLSGAPVVVNLTVQDASGLPAKWTTARLESLGNKVQALSVPGVLAAAADKLATVSAWAISERRAAVEAAAANMQQAAALLQAVQAMQAGGAWVDVGEVVPVDPDPDPDPVDPDPDPVDPDPDPVDPDPVVPPDWVADGNDLELVLPESVPVSGTFDVLGVDPVVGVWITADWLDVLGVNVGARLIAPNGVAVFEDTAPFNRTHFMSYQAFESGRYTFEFTAFASVNAVLNLSIESEWRY